MAAHLEGKGATVLDQTGLAQKGGAVTCHLRIARVAGRHPRGAHRGGRSRSRARLRHGRRQRLLGAVEDPRRPRARRAEHVRGDAGHVHDEARISQFPAKQIVDAVTFALDGDEPELVDATRLATKLLGDSIASNLFMLGYAWQKGWVPISLDALMRAVELNARRGRDEQVCVQLGTSGRARHRASRALPPVSGLRRARLRRNGEVLVRRPAER